MRHGSPGQPAIAELRYVSARNLSRHVLDLDRREISGLGGESLGTLDAILVDIVTGRPAFIVVDAGEWLGGRRFLIPAGSTRFDAGQRGLAADLDRGAVSRIPELDDRPVEALRGDELGRSRDDVTRACCPDDIDLRRLDLERRMEETGRWWNAAGWLTSMVPGAPTTSPGDAVGDGRADEARGERRDRD